MSKYIKIQKTRVIQSRKDSSRTEQSSYWDDVISRGEGSDGTAREHPCANPDMLLENDDSTPSTPQLILGEAIEHLQGRQKECYILTMREEKSLSEVAEILGITKSSAQVYVNRAVKFLTAYCQAAIAKGRV